MSSEISKRDQNSVPVLTGVTDDASLEIRMLRVNPVTGRLLVSSTGGGSSVAYYEFPADSDSGGVYTVPANTAFLALWGSNTPSFYSSTQYSGSGTTTLTLDLTKVNSPAVGYFLLAYTP